MSQVGRSGLRRFRMLVIVLFFVGLCAVLLPIIALLLPQNRSDLEPIITLMVCAAMGIPAVFAAIVLLAADRGGVGMRWVFRGVVLGVSAAFLFVLATTPVVGPWNAGAALFFVVIAVVVDCVPPRMPAARQSSQTPDLT